ncbi:MAG TPA: hypothetical protein VN181_09915 [Thermoanaerobaculia bacterium]|nr:hypothetical protein [Thermoanaerobaculia bacterium]
MGSLALLDSCERIMKETYTLLRQSDALITRRITLLRETAALTADVIATGRIFSDNVPVPAGRSGVASLGDGSLVRMIP